MAREIIYPFVLCGGAGTRLWPISTGLEPKQFHALSTRRSMLMETLARVEDEQMFARPTVIGSARHARQLASFTGIADQVLEPLGRNSAPAVAIACLLRQPDDLVLILPADHHIADVPAFHAALETGAASARQGRIVTLGITPDRPATGYGYIEGTGEGAVQPAQRFVEKPDEETAQAYLDSGRFYWNAGIFLFAAGTMTEALRQHAPDIFEGVSAALSGHALDRHAFAAVRSESIDYAVLEHADNIDVVPVDMGWSDLGDYKALHDLKADAGEERLIALGDVSFSRSKSVFAYSDGVPLAVQGVENIAIAVTRRGVLVTDLESAAAIKSVVAGAQDIASLFTPARREKISDWLYGQVLPAWAERAFDPASGIFTETLDNEGAVVQGRSTRGRVAPRQMYTFACAKRLGWNPDGAADRVIERALEILSGPGRSTEGGWVHQFDAEGRIEDPRRDLYDHAFVALAASALCRLGDPRGEALAEEAFATIDELFADTGHGGWADMEVAPGPKRANPHMHLLEACLAHYEATGSAASLERAHSIATLFERFMFEPETGALLEVFEPDWSRVDARQVEPGHCYEWAYLLHELDRVSGRDTQSWVRRMVRFAEAEGLANGFALDVIGAEPATCRLWPQLERLRALSHVAPDPAELNDLLDMIFAQYLDHGAAWAWRDQVSPAGETLNANAPASMLYHFMTALAPLAPKPA